MKPTFDSFSVKGILDILFLEKFFQRMTIKGKTAQFIFVNLTQKLTINILGFPAIFANWLTSWLQLEWSNRKPLKWLMQVIFANKILLQHIHVHLLVYCVGWFHITTVFSTCKRHQMAHKVENVYKMAFHRKSFLIQAGENI